MSCPIQEIAREVARDLIEDVAEMDTILIKLVLLSVAGWMHSEQANAIAYLLEENRVLKEQLGGRRVRFTDAQRRRLAHKGKLLGRAALRRFATIATPDTILGWYRKLIARKYDGSTKRVSMTKRISSNRRSPRGLRPQLRSG